MPFENNYARVMHVRELNKPYPEGALLTDGSYFIKGGNSPTINQNSSISLILKPEYDAKGKATNQFAQLLDYAREQYSDPNLTSNQARANITVKMHALFAAAGQNSSYDPTIAGDIADDGVSNSTDDYYYKRGGKTVHVDTSGHISSKASEGSIEARHLSGFAPGTLICAEHAKILATVDAILLNERDAKKNLYPQLNEPVFYAGGMVEFNPVTEKPGHHAFLITPGAVQETTASTIDDVMKPIVSQYIRGFPNVLPDVHALRQYNPGIQKIIPVSQDGVNFSFYTLPATRYREDDYERFHEYLSHAHERLTGVLQPQHAQIRKDMGLPPYTGALDHKPIGPSMTVEWGDTLYTIAGIYKASGHPISVEELRTANGIDEQGTIKGGATLQNPYFYERAKHHVVEKGDTLYKICQRYNVSERALCLANGIEAKDVIRPGQRLDLQSARDIAAMGKGIQTLKAQSQPGFEDVEHMYDLRMKIDILQNKCATLVEHPYEKTVLPAVPENISGVLQQSGVLADNASSGILLIKDIQRDLKNLTIALEDQLSNPPAGSSVPRKPSGDLTR
jgi:LysM repeat protein